MNRNSTNEKSIVNVLALFFFSSKMGGHKISASHAKYDCIDRVRITWELKGQVTHHVTEFDNIEFFIKISCDELRRERNFPLKKRKRKRDLFFEDYFYIVQVNFFFSSNKLIIFFIS